MKAHFLGIVRSCRSGIYGHAFLGLAAQQFVDGQSPQMSQRIPNGQIQCTQRLYRNTLASIIHRRSPALIPNQLDIGRILSLYKSRQVLFDDVARRIATDGNAHTDHAIGQFDFHNDTAHGVNAPRRAGGTVLFVHTHGIGNVAVDDPMSRGLFVAIGATTTLLFLVVVVKDVGTDCMQNTESMVYRKRWT